MREQFVVFENVLDKKRLRQIFLGIFGVFSTLVPLMLAFNSDGADTIHYASFNDRPEIYAFNPSSRSYPESVEFCADHWMRPVVFRSIEELQAMHFLTRGKMAYLGAQRARPFRAGEPPADLDGRGGGLAGAPHAGRRLRGLLRRGQHLGAPRNPVLPPRNPWVH